MFIYDCRAWPNWVWDADALSAPLASVRHRQGRLLGYMAALGFSLQQEAVLRTLTQDALKTSEIEGETLNAEQVRSSLARRLGIDIGALRPADREVEGLVELLLDATQQYDQRLTVARLHAWHAALFPTGRSGLGRIRAGEWRDDASGPMQVVSGPYGRERVHYEAPPAARLDREVEVFLTWLNAPPGVDKVLTAGLAHLWFVTLHPFDDGNGRIARAIADLALARSEGSPQRFYSMSAQIRQERNDYYSVLERTQRGTLDVTEWLSWFLGCLGRAIDNAQVTLAAVLTKARVWESLARVALNDRQRLVLNRLLDGFVGNLTTSKWAKLANTSHDTALRDIQQLVDAGVLVRNVGGGRSTSYRLAALPETAPGA